jgi:hypothetical protein
MLEPVALTPETFCTNAGEAFGVTVLDGAESGPVPTELVAETVNV